MRLFLSILIFVLVLSSGVLPAQAQDRHIIIDKHEESQLSDEDKRKMMDRSASPPPMEPAIPQVKFLKIDPPGSLGERVDRLLHGIYTDLPPEYDHYGYELRRYMAGIGGPAVLEDQERIQKELANIRKAKIIFKYWRNLLLKEIKDIEKTIEEQSASSKVRSNFKYNRGIVNAFLVECRGWINNNEAMLEFLTTVPDDYVYNDPVFTFRNEKDRVKFVSLFKAREKARGHIKEYAPFMLMVY